MLVPLSKLMTSVDNAVANMGLCSGYVFALTSGAGIEVPFLLDNLERAVIRVVDKWSLLRGQPVWLDEEDIWAINVPDDLPSVQKPFLFTATTLQTSYAEAVCRSSPPTPLSTVSPCGFQAQPDMAYFRHPHLPSTFAAYADSGASLLAVHVTVFSDAVAVGLATPHGLFDATGLGYAVRAVNAELSGGMWTVPASSPVNGLDQAIQGLDGDGTGDLADIPDGLAGWVPALSTLPVLKFLANYLYEKLWHRDEPAYIFLGGHAVDGFVKSVKDEVENMTNGRAWVSKGDVLTAWLLKNAHAADQDARTSVVASAVYTLRALFPLASYPHNAMIPYPLMPEPISAVTLSTLSIAQLALIHRQSLSDSRNIPYVNAVIHKMRDAPLIPEHSWPWAGLLRGGPRPPFRWISSNQTTSGVADLQLPMCACAPRRACGEGSDAVLDTLAYYMVVISAIKDHQVFRFQANSVGVFLEGSMRRERWRNVAEAVRLLEKEYGIPQ
ncbi:hypothetical protein JCM3770_002483 [Rhodotorula araucariae]